MSGRRSLVAGLGLALVAPLVGQGAGSAAPAVDPVVSRATDFLHATQQADGGFELAGFPGFETPDATLALAASLQAGPAWDAAAARVAIQAAESDSGNDPLDALDDLIDNESDPSSDAAGARAAKITALVAEPLGIAPTDFDPSADSSAAVDLVARMDQHRLPDGSYDFGAQFNGALYAAIALAGAGRPVPTGLVSQILTGQRTDGSWDYTGTTTGDGEDIDTTALALVALRSAGRTVAHPAVVAGVRFLAARQQASGAWQSFGADDPNSTSSVVLALSDLHIDLGTAAWRTTYGSPAPGAYVPPTAWLRGQQAPDGHIASPNDSFGLNTFPTSQSMQALSRHWFLAAEHEHLTRRLARALGSPAGSPSVAAAQVAADALGANASVKASRLAAARAVLASPFGRQAAAADLFQQAFGRTLDPSGRAYWSEKLRTISRTEMLARLTGSSEFYRRAGGTTASFVDAVYRSVLGRAPEPGGRAYWVARIDAGMPVDRVARSLVASSEYRRRQVDAAYQRVVGRTPAAADRAYWTAKLATTRIEVLLAALGSSLELYEQTPA